MNKLRSIFVVLWDKTKSLSPLVPLMLVSLLLALLLGGGNDLVGASSLFQSPPPTREEPTPTPPPPTATPEPTATPVPTDTPVPTSEPTVTSVPTEATEEPTVEPTEEPMPEPTEEPTVEPSEEPAPESPEEPEGEEEAPLPEESPPMIFNWGVFLNTVILTLSYVWICCGVCALVGAPLAFILLYVGGKRRLRQRPPEPLSILDMAGST